MVEEDIVQPPSSEFEQLSTTEAASDHEADTKEASRPEEDASSQGEASRNTVLKEVFDDQSEPTQQELLEYAAKLGICPNTESELLRLAREGLLRTLPNQWKPCLDENTQTVYYFNFETGQTQWEHPLDQEYREKVLLERENLRSLRSPSRNFKEVEEDETTEASGDTTDILHSDLNMDLKASKLAPLGPIGKPALGPIGLKAALPPLKKLGTKELAPLDRASPLGPIGRLSPLGSERLSLSDQTPPSAPPAPLKRAAPASDSSLQRRNQLDKNQRQSSTESKLSDKDSDGPSLRLNERQVKGGQSGLGTGSKNDLKSPQSTTSLRSQCSTRPRQSPSKSPESSTRSSDNEAKPREQPAANIVIKSKSPNKGDHAHASNKPETENVEDSAPTLTGKLKPLGSLMGGQSKDRADLFLKPRTPQVLISEDDEDSEDESDLRKLGNQIVITENPESEKPEVRGILKSVEMESQDKKARLLRDSLHMRDSKRIMFNLDANMEFNSESEEETTSTSHAEIRGSTKKKPSFGQIYQQGYSGEMQRRDSEKSLTSQEEESSDGNTDFISKNILDVTSLKAVSSHNDQNREPEARIHRDEAASEAANRADYEPDHVLVDEDEDESNLGRLEQMLTFTEADQKAGRSGGPPKVDRSEVVKPHQTDSMYNIEQEEDEVSVSESTFPYNRSQDTDNSSPKKIKTADTTRQPGKKSLLKNLLDRKISTPVNQVDQNLEPSPSLSNEQQEEAENENEALRSVKIAVDTLAILREKRQEITEKETPRGDQTPAKFNLNQMALKTKPKEITPSMDKQKECWWH